MKVQDFVIFGSNATAALAIGANEDITWEHNLLTYYEVDQNEAIELVELGVWQDEAVERVYVRNKDNMDWQTNGFITLGCSVGHNCTELPYERRPDFTKILAPIAPESPQRASPTLKLPTGDYLRVNKTNAVTHLAAASASKTQAIAIVRKFKAQDTAEQEIVQNYDSMFGGLNSNGQLWHENATLGTGTANVWNDIISMTLLKNELFAFNKIGAWHAVGLAAGEVDKYRIYIDEQIEYNKYPAPTTVAQGDDYIVSGAECSASNMLPFNDGFYFFAWNAEEAAISDSRPYYCMPRMYIFDKPLVVTKAFNKRLQFQVQGSATMAVTSTPCYYRMTGMKYRLGA